MIEFKNVTKTYGTKKAIDDISLNIGEGMIVGIMGENGAGKTTLLKILSGLCKSDHGYTYINGNIISVNTHKDIAYMGDEVNLFTWFKVKDAILYFKDMFPDFDDEKCESLCKSLSIDKNEKIKSLSKGMQERVMLMLTFSRNVKIFVLDEPLGGVDPLAKDMIIKTIISNTDEEKTIIISTHLIKDVENIFDRVIFIKKGKIISDMITDDIRLEHKKSIEQYYLEVMKNA